MAPPEHEILQLKMKGIAQDTIIKWMAGMLRVQLGVSPEAAREAFLTGMEAKLRSGTAEYADLTIPWLDAASSDLQAALFQEAYEEVSKKVIDIVGAGLTPQEIVQLRAAGS